MAGLAGRAGMTGRTGRAGRAGSASTFLNNKLYGNRQNCTKCTQRHPDKSFQKTNRNVQVLPKQKTHDTYETFEHKWQWFFGGSRTRDGMNCSDTRCTHSKCAQMGFPKSFLLPGCIISYFCISLFIHFYFMLCFNHVMSLLAKNTI